MLTDLSRGALPSLVLSGRCPPPTPPPPLPGLGRPYLGTNLSGDEDVELGGTQPHTTPHPSSGLSSLQPLVPGTERGRGDGGESESLSDCETGRARDREGERDRQREIDVLYCGH